MKKLLLVLIVISLAIGIVVYSSANNERDTAKPENQGKAQNKTLRPFESQKELENYLRDLAKQQRGRREAAGNTGTADAQAYASPAESKSEKDSDDSITNVQHQGVDEGGIVKLHGNHLVILRRGRLFTVAIGDYQLKPISFVDAFGPEINPNGTWYDEMLVSGNTVAVIGYSYERGGTEIGLFNIDDAGNLRYRSTYHLRSNDYYSSRNYASRLVGNKLVFYTPSYLWLNSENPTESFPALRKWHKGATEKEFQSIVAPTSVYKPARPVNSNYGLALHTVTACDLGNEQFNCKATAVIGPAGRVFYVSPKSVYVWVTDWWSARQGKNNESRSMLYQMPLDGTAPSALGVSGSPVDQFSFLESEDGYLNVLVRSEAAGDGMWKAEVAAGDAALMRIPVNSFSDGSENVATSSYRELPKPAQSYTFQNRFVGDYLLYGSGSGWYYPNEINRMSLYAVRYTQGEVNEVKLKHGVDRIEAMGRDAVIAGTDGKDLHFSSIRLDDKPNLVSRYTRKNAAQGELRSHGFFYKPVDENTGLLGLPVRDSARPGYENLYEDSASILFLRNDSLNLREIGELESQPNKKSMNDGCRASCVDWYGNARPLFIRGRVFALLGYELVEGSLTTNGIRETRRIRFSPQASRNRT